MKVGRIEQLTHTPGPWHVGEKRHDYDNLIRNADNDPVAAVYISGYGPKTGLANVRLIAAAPDLLAACKAALSELEWEHAPMGPAAETLRTAIAKAESR